MPFNLGSERTKQQKAFEGRWIALSMELGDEVVDLGCEVLIASPNSPSLVEKRERLEKQYRLEHGNLKPEKKIPDDAMLDIWRKAIVGTVLLDWKGVEDEDGEDLPFSDQKALEMLRDPDMWRFSAAVMGAINHVDALADAEEEAVVKN